MRKMKNSGIEWIGDIPSNWNVMPNKYIMKKVKEICPIYNGEDIISLSMNGVIIRDLDAGGKMPTTFNGYQKIYKGNLLMCLFDIDVTPRCIGMIKNDGLTSPAYSQFTLYNNAYSPYYCYYYTMLDNEKTLVHLAKNLRHSLTEEQLGTINIPVPPIEEQQQIADYLDRQCAEIDALKADIQKQLETLEEYKRSVITEAVTKGLDADVEMRDSGVEWIGEIPKHWDIDRLKYHFSFGKGLPITKENLTENGIAVISYGQIHSKTNNGTKINESLIRYVNDCYLSTNPFSLVNKNDFIFADTSEDLEGCGNSIFIDREMQLFAGYHTIILKSLDKTNKKYFAYLFLTDCWRKQIRCKVSGVKVFSITQKIIKEAEIIIPPIEEQQQIADYLDEKCAGTDGIIAEKKKQLETLEEYKKSLIYEYVTGKKEVEKIV